MQLTLIEAKDERERHDCRARAHLASSIDGVAAFAGHDFPAVLQNDLHDDAERGAVGRGIEDGVTG